MKYIRFTFEFIAVEWKKFFMRVFLMSVSLFLIQFSLLYYRGISYGYENCDRVLSSGIDGTARIEMEDIYESEFLKDAVKLDEIAAIGSMADYGGPSGGLEELLQIQMGGDTGDGMITTRDINPTLLPICEMELKEGTPYWELDYSKPDTIYVYLGSDYEGIPVGTRYEQKIDGRFYIYWEVAGIFPEGFRWITEHMISAGNIATMDYTEDCSHLIFYLDDEIFTTGAYLCAADGYTIEESIAALKKLADSRGITFTYNTLSESFKEGRQFADVLSGIIFKMFIIFLLCGFFMIINFQTLSLIESGRDMGIMLSVGFCPTFLKKVFLIKDCIQGLIAILVSLSLSLLIARQIFIRDNIEYILKNLCLKNLIPVSLLIAAAIVAVGSVITHVIFKKMNPVRLIRRA